MNLTTRWTPSALTARPPSATPQIPANTQNQVPGNKFHLPIPYDFTTLKHAWKASWESGFRSPRQIMAKTLYTAANLGVWGTNNFCYLADEVFFPAYREQPLNKPIFILANPRSGTTLLHRLMSLDEERFRSFKLYQTLFPSIIAEKFISGAAALDRAVGSPVAKFVGFAESALFAFWKGIHGVGFAKPEECVNLWLTTMLSPALYLFFPSQRPFERAEFVDRLPDEERRRWFEYYGATVKRLLYGSGPNQTFLTKNVLMTGAMATVLEGLPDARFAYLVRHPYETIPSLLSMFHAAMRMHSPDLPKDSPAMRNLARMLVDYYRYLMECRKNLPPERFQIIRYQDLIANPMAVIESLYRDFEIPLDDATRARLIDACQNEKNRESGHKYSLEEYGLTREEIRAQLSDVFEEFGFEA